MCLFAMMAAGRGLKAQDITITLEPGWNWISYPNAEVMDVASALGGFAPVEGDQIKSRYTTSRYTRGRWGGGVTHLMPGWGYMYYSARSETVEFSFAQSSSTSLATATPTDITATSAVVGGTVTVPEGTHVFLRGVCWGTEPSPDIDGDHTDEGTGIGSFSGTLEGLNPNTTYYVRAYAVSDHGLAYGNELIFTTMSGIPVVTTAEVSDVTGNSALCGGTVTDGGGFEITARGVCWSTSHNPTLSDSHTTDGTGTGSFTSSITGLGTSTTYYVRAYATTAQATSYGEEMTFTTMSGIPTVSTAEVTDITATTATCGGTIATDGGLAITARGVCWSTSHNPTLGDSHTTDGTGTGSFTSTITGLNASTTYYVRAYASNSLVTIYGGEQSFTTEAGGGSGGDHAYVDLGLPSGLLWATCNVGADNPEDYGDYFAWGETQPKDTYSWSTYQYCNGGDGWNTLTKYCNNSSYGYNGFTDDLTSLLPEDDAATANWGSDWRMPTKEEWQELYNNTTHTWTTQNGVNGRLFTASNGNSLFLPAAGYRNYSSFVSAGSYGNYWSSSLIAGSPNYAWYFYFYSGSYYVNSDDRIYGLSVRGVRVGSQNTAPTGAIDGKFTINANGDQVYFSQGNLQYIGSAATPYWKFADNQWDVLGTTTGQNSRDENVDRDLFGWGTSGYNHGAFSYQPWITLTVHIEYYAYGSYTYNLYDQTGQADWGYNPISNGGNQANQWRTLAKNEWFYVFSTRTTNSGIRYAKANVNNVNGVILLPDNWSSDTYSLSNTNSSGASYSSNTISATQWSALEQAGAVFLPTAGSRVGTSVNLVGSNGYYWSASYYNSDSACGMYFNNSNLNAGSNHYRGNGQSVRLVAPAEN